MAPTFKLIDSKTKQEVTRGSKVKTFRGEEVILVDYSFKRVFVKSPGQTFTNEFFPGVINCEIVETTAAKTDAPS